MMTQAAVCRSPEAALTIEPIELVLVAAVGLCRTDYHLA